MNRRGKKGGGVWMHLNGVNCIADIGCVWAQIQKALVGTAWVGYFSPRKPSSFVGCAFLT